MTDDRSDPASVPTGHFDALYERSDDPWDYETGDYEQRKFARTVAALPRPFYPSGFELGCSIGVLTGKLAARCGRLVGGDCSARAIALARQKNARPNVEFMVMRAPLDLPAAETFDLIVLSEVLYFFSPDDLRAVTDFVAGAANPTASIMLVNYLGPTEHAATGDQAADAFIAGARPWSRQVAAIREAEFRIDVLERDRPA